MRIIFRADGNSEIGWGHVMRSLSIASAAKDLGAECFFVCADDSMRNLIESKDFYVFVLDTDYRDMESETDRFIEVINKEKPDSIFVDSYYVSNKYFRTIKKHSKVIYLDDVFSFPYDVDYLINYNIYASYETYSELYSENTIPELLLGTEYIPLREEFIRNIPSGVRNESKKVFVSTGGSDEFGLVLRIINKLKDDKELSEGIEYHFIIGSYEPDFDEINSLSECNKWIHLHRNVKNMSEIMNICDVAISAAGSTLYELCSCGVPTITYVIADNQIGGANGFKDKKIMLNAGDLRTVDFDCSGIIDNLKMLMNDFELRKRLSEKMLSVVDGKGAERIIKKICETGG